MEADVSLMARNFKNMVRQLDKGVSRSFSEFQGVSNVPTEVELRETQRPMKTSKIRKMTSSVMSGEGFDYFQRKCPLFKRKELKCAEYKGVGHLKTECPNLENKNGDKSLMCFSNTESEDEGDNKDLLLNFVALVGAESSSSDSVTSDDDERAEVDVKKEY